MSDIELEDRPPLGTLDSMLERAAYREWQDAIRDLHRIHNQMGPAQERVRRAHENLAKFAIKEGVQDDSSG